MNKDAEQLVKEKIENAATDLMYKFAVMPQSDQTEIIQAIFESKPNFTKHIEFWNGLFAVCRNSVQISNGKPTVSEIKEKFASDINYTKGLDGVFAKTGDKRPKRTSRH